MEINGDEEQETDLIRLIDFSDPDENEFLVVNQFTVQGTKQPRRPDLVAFINGLPLAVIELKNPDLLLDYIRHFIIFERDAMRIKWWENPEGLTYDSIAVGNIKGLRDLPVLNGESLNGSVYGRDEQPVH